MRLIILVVAVAVVLIAAVTVCKAEYYMPTSGFSSAAGVASSDPPGSVFITNSIGVPIAGISYNMDHILLAGFARWDTCPVVDVSTDIEDEDRPFREPRLVLEQNCPNPFAPTTRINYTIPGPAGVSRNTQLAIFDATGRLVTTLLRGSLPAGRHQMVWDGRNSKGHEVSSGVYHVRLRSGNLAATTRVVLLR
ncbi:MAG: T9SS type A sorting domain-containing protein [Candidatus Eisenbacteria sp.]|nr:T9SS type A sorting domain-containing protein [Candidatus Eisenbacteria bacterium]